MTKKNSKRQNRSPIQKISIMSLVQRPLRNGSKRQNRIPIQKTSMIFGPAPENSISSDKMLSRLNWK